MYKDPLYTLESRGPEEGGDLLNVDHLFFINTLLFHRSFLAPLENILIMHFIMQPVDQRTVENKCL